MSTSTSIYFDLLRKRIDAVLGLIRADAEARVYYVDHRFDLPAALPAPCELVLEGPLAASRHATDDLLYAREVLSREPSADAHGMPKGGQER